MTKAKPASFEASLHALETLVRQMDSGELSLEDSLEAFEKGISLVRQCQQQLQTAEQKVQKLVATHQGLQLEPFNQSSPTTNDHDDVPF